MTSMDDPLLVGVPSSPLEDEKKSEARQRRALLSPLDRVDDYGANDEAAAAASSSLPSAGYGVGVGVGGGYGATDYHGGDDDYGVGVGVGLDDFGGGGRGGRGGGGLYDSNKTPRHANTSREFGRDDGGDEFIRDDEEEEEVPIKTVTPTNNNPHDMFGGDGNYSPLSLSRFHHLGAIQRQHSLLRRASMADPKRVPLRKVQSSSFWEDARDFREGTIPQSVAVALVVGIVCGVAAFVYYQILFFLLDYLWHTLPEMYVVDVWFENLYVLWIPIVGLLMAVLVGLSVMILGEPGDLAYTIKCVHDKAYVSMSHVLPMVAASQFSILGGGSLGPEAPLVAICASLGGHISRKLFRQRNRNVVRKHTLMGMAGALAAFFGCPLGGSLFALEVNSRFGVEYFEHMVEAIFCGEVCLAVFRALSGLPIDAIWTIEIPAMQEAQPIHLVMGAVIGLLGAGVAALFAAFHFRVMDVYERWNLLDNRRAVPRALLGGIVIVTLGMMVPHTMFWGEYEFQTISTMGAASELEHVWPTSGLFGFEMDSWYGCLVVAFTKLIAISFTVAGGYRGGFIFPFFACGAALGRAFVLIFPWADVPIPLACLSFAAGINVAITRTSLATPLILTYLAGEQCAISGVLAASLVSLFATSYMPFIKTQIVRKDLDSSLFYLREDEPMVLNDSTHSGNSGGGGGGGGGDRNGDGNGEGISYAYES